MTLPTDTNEQIARMDGWTESATGWQSPSGTRLFCPPPYRCSLDLIEPVFRRLWGRTLISYLDGRIMIATQTENILFADTLAEAMCAAVLATRGSVTTINQTGGTVAFANEGPATTLRVGRTCPDCGGCGAIAITPAQFYRGMTPRCTKCGGTGTLYEQADTTPD